ncbi:Putative inner membrane protein [Salmonella enterica subsp. enterica serovar Urbana str. R8-2977]|uniref:Putative inner membrane protein n=7 Tax=Salmonella TaxID=590 RepID=G5RRM1_SALET|nr:Putative inner membrane protein [Salmonella enterica subsp. enterica serovar Urbana str. R8-2977]
MTEIQRLLSETIDDLNVREKRDNRPRFSISFIRKHPGLFIAMYAAWFATLAVMLQSETLVGSVWLLVVLFIAFNGFFFFDIAPRYPRYHYNDIDIAPRYHYNDIDVLDLRVCYNGEWYNTRFVPPTLIETILQSPQVDNEHKVQLQKMVARKGELSFYDIFTLARAEASR